MTKVTEIIMGHLIGLEKIRAKTAILENLDQLNLALIDNGICLIYASWSSPAIINFIQATKMLDKANYHGQVLIIDIDLMSPEFQLRTFGQISQGWTETYIIKQGKIRKSFSGSKSAKIFTEYFTKEILFEN